jgi:hypothetical protein
VNEFGKGRKRNFMELLISKPLDVLEEKQKENKVRNLLLTMKCEGTFKIESDNKQKSY